MPTVKDVANAYLATQKAKADRELITPHWFDDCTRTLKDFVESVGKNRPSEDVRSEDFARYRLGLYNRYGTCTIDRYIMVVRAAFKHAFDTGLIDQAVKYGGQFNKPTKKEQRISRIERDRENSKRLFEPKQIKALLKEARQPLRAMILLGINGGFGNTDCAELPISAINMTKTLIDYPRPKTAVQRIVPLWPETVSALREVLEENRLPARKTECEKLVFLTTFGNPWKQDELRDGGGEAPLEDFSRPTAGMPVSR